MKRISTNIFVVTYIYVYQSDKQLNNKLKTKIAPEMDGLI